MTRTELLRIIDEFKSERDAAKEDALRAFDQRNIAQNVIVRLEVRINKLEQALLDTICYLEMNGDADATSIALNEGYRAGLSDARMNEALAAAREKKK
jgi:hypothetical protein